MRNFYKVVLFSVLTLGLVTDVAAVDPRLSKILNLAFLQALMETALKLAIRFSATVARLQ